MTMSNGKHGNGKLVPVVAYYRMSTDKQEDSIDRQRSQVIPYAARHGYTIVREYVDEGIAGDEGKKRKAFMRMLADAEGHRDFDVILCDDKDRFGRFDTIDHGYYVKPLRDAGLRIETVAQGRVDWSSFAGRITDAILQEAKKIESQALSRRVITQMLMMARQGKWLGGVPPYGYAVVADPELGKRLVLGLPEQVEAVRLMFEMYGERGRSLEQVAEELYKRGVADPSGRPNWQRTTIRAILRNQKYVGDTRWNAGHDGKYSEVEGGTVRTSDQRITPRVNRKEDWIIVEETHEPLVSRELFAKVQRNLDANRGRTSPAPKCGLFVLSGLLACGHCGWQMIGSTWGGKRYYKCGRYHLEGKRGCKCNMISEEKLVRCLARKLEQVALDPANTAELRAEIRRQAEARAAGKSDAPRATRLRRQVKELDQKIEQGMERMALIDADLLADFAAKVRSWKDERAMLEKGLATLGQSAASQRDLEIVLRAADAELARLREALLSADPHQRREVFREMVSKIEVRFDHYEVGKQTRARFREGTVHLRPQERLDWSAILCNAASPIQAGPGATG
jgi:DNA invertase Pin-like site-specific DNA recombinase